MTMFAPGVRTSEQPSTMCLTCMNKGVAVCLMSLFRRFRASNLLQGEVHVRPSRYSGVKP
ncbi:hypothetical protein HMPREF1861_01558 [Corynebacterium kroppenstedtii]|nr:hypothetical protein HMPREF1861_01558 [Corynebacterium kroppenstedtii]